MLNSILEIPCIYINKKNWTDQRNVYSVSDKHGNMQNLAVFEF